MALSARSTAGAAFRNTVWVFAKAHAFSRVPSASCAGPRGVPPILVDRDAEKATFAAHLHLPVVDKGGFEGHSGGDAKAAANKEMPQEMAKNSSERTGEMPPEKEAFQGL